MANQYSILFLSCNNYTTSHCTKITPIQLKKLQKVVKEAHTLFLVFYHTKHSLSYSSRLSSITRRSQNCTRAMLQLLIGSVDVFLYTATKH